MKRKKNLCRSIYIMYRVMHEWSSRKWLEDGWTDIQPEHLRLISIISADNWNNNELAKKARVSKQAMSKMVTLLESRGFIDVLPDPNDSRAKIISISKKGVDFMEYFYNNTREFAATFVDILGTTKTNRLVELLSELSEGLIERENAEMGVTLKS
ncbi:MAG TPA: MarR family transcriptional regulator [Chitinophagales bacterium]|nr:MarR family transcriptional regulator [Chitinophagales bacterium]